ncbi:hypothetical protein C4552_01870 [Candidatus Parcubacteria bacterium]|nr:MAG: hypothetical protein C4552_01870 [Candidatus Parcubacteria bacterium]
MLFFVYGADTYRSRKKLAHIVADLEKKAGGALAVTRIDGAEAAAGRADASPIKAVGRTASLFSEKELYVIERISEADASDWQYVKARLAEWNDDKRLAVVFWEGAADRTAKPYITAIAAATPKKQCQEFKMFTPALAERWIAAEAAARGLMLSAHEIGMLAERFGGDTWALAHEMEKIAHGWSVTREAARGDMIWHFADSFLQNRLRAFRPLYAILAAGEEPIAIVGALASSLRALAQVWHGLRHNDVARSTARLHPFVVKKHAGIAGRLDRAAIAAYFADLARADRELKTGGLPPPLPLERLVFQKSAPR